MKIEKANQNLRAIVYALAAALFYALNVPCSKALLKEVPPTYMAAFLYLGAGIGVGVMYLIYGRKSEAKPLNRKDAPYVIGMIVLDIVAPILLMVGIRLGNASNASLLGNFEIVATSLIAFWFFREKISGRLWTAIVLVSIASAVLSFAGEGSFTFSAGSLFVLAAASCWGLENNCTRRISDKSTYQIVTVKGLCSGTGSLLIALALGERFPDFGRIPVILLLGFIAYGLSIFSYVRAQSVLGAACTGAYYAAAPFLGVILSIVFLRERPDWIFAIALIIMLVGTVLVVKDSTKR